MRLKQIDSNGVSLLYNAKVKFYEDGTKNAIHFSFDIEKGRSKQCFGHNGTSTLEDKENYSKKHLKMTKTNIIDIALNNSNCFDYFITLTFSDVELKDKTYTHDNAMNALSKWLNNQRHRNPDMCYLIVPEFHKSGRLHFHGLVGRVPKWRFQEAINPNTGKLIKENGLQIYNLTNYTLGYTTVSIIQDKEKVSNYIAKYATKELIDLKFKKRYWYSRNLTLPTTDYIYLDPNESILDDYTFSKDFVKYYRCIEKENSKLEVLRSVPIKED